MRSQLSEKPGDVLVGADNVNGGQVLLCGGEFQMGLEGGFDRGEGLDVFASRKVLDLVLDHPMHAAVGDVHGHGSLQPLGLHLQQNVVRVDDACHGNSLPSHSTLCQLVLGGTNVVLVGVAEPVDVLDDSLEWVPQEEHVQGILLVSLVDSFKVPKIGAPQHAVGIDGPVRLADSDSMSVAAESIK